MCANKREYLGLFGFIILTGYGSACTHSTAEEVEKGKKINDTTVQTAHVSRLKFEKLKMSVFPATLDLPGRIVIPDKDLYVLGARVQGRLDSVKMTVGDSVTTGQIIATLWSPDLVTAAEELKIARDQKSESLLKLTQDKLRAMGLDPKDIDSEKTSFPLRSPITGVVLETRLKAGSTVNAGDTILTIGKTTNYQFHGELSPSQAVDVNVGDEVHFEDDPGLKAKVISVSPVADPTSRLVKIRCSFDGTVPRSLPQETFLKAQIITGKQEGLVASSKSLIFTDGNEFVFIKSKQEGEIFQFRRIKVSIIARNKKQLSINPSIDIKEGEEIVTEGALMLNDLLEDNT